MATIHDTAWRETTVEPFRLASFPHDPDPGALLVLWNGMAPVAGSSSPVVRAIMITTVDGRSTIDGLSGPLGTPTDHLLFHLMRARAGLVVVGARTALAEDYGPSTIDPRLAHLRADPEPPRLALLARSIRDETIDHCLRRGPEGFTLVVPAGVDGIDRAERAGLHVHPFRLDAARGLRALADEFGAREVVVEGGPSLLASALSADVVDELVLTTSPQVDVDGDGLRLVGHSDRFSGEFRVHSAFTSPDGGLYARWVRHRAGRG